MPSSTTATRCSERRRNSVSGTPMSLFRLPSVASAASPCQTRRIEAIICVTVVLPLLPVTAMSGPLKRWRHWPASSPRASLASGTSTPGRPQAASWAAAPSSHSTATAPRAAASGRKLAASKRSPFRATNRSPACRLRVSVCTRAQRTAPSPTRRALLSQPASSCNVRFMALMRTHLPTRRAAAGPGARSPGRKTGCACRALPGSPRGPCRRSAPRRPDRRRPARARWPRRDRPR